MLILLTGFAASFGVLAVSKNRRLIESVDRMTGQFSAYKVKNAATSGAYMALNKLYLNKTWRTGYSNLVIAGDTLNVTVTDNSADPSLGLYRVKVTASGRNGAANTQTQVVVFDRGAHEFAVWAKDTVINITTRDSLGMVNPALRMQKAPFMPKIDRQSLIDQADAQDHVRSGSKFKPEDGYPNGSFYYSGTTPNVTHVLGNLEVKSDRTIYGIFVVEGHVELAGDSRINGILYLPNTSSTIRHGGNDSDESVVKGAVLTWGSMNGSGGSIVVRHFPQFIQKFVVNYAPENPPIRVLSWK
ncbi:MAG: hypothetical protein ONB43_06270 [candidate division KSB1 bacterium]|nr:hypothetical protein [candidate division KSB1 bacterium]MDZ7403490.1 hypothetical protein [candidate division KSB1 bacterium]